MHVSVEQYIPNPLQCYKCFKYGHHENNCRQEHKLCRRCSTLSSEHDTDPCTHSFKCANCGGEHFSTSKSCPAWQREKEVVSVKVREGLSFPEAKKIVAARMNILTSYANVTKNATKPVEKKDFSTQTIIVAVHKAPVELTSSAKGNVSDSHEPQCNTNNSKQNKSAPSTSQTPAPVSKTQGPRPKNESNKNKTKVVESDRQPKGSDDPIKNHNRFSCLDEDMEVENPIAESSTQGKIKKITFPK